MPTIYYPVALDLVTSPSTQGLPRIFLAAIYETRLWVFAWVARIDVVRQNFTTLTCTFYLVERFLAMHPTTRSSKEQKSRALRILQPRIN
jgi:hypothetical protein